jgi:hypothetical protein
MSSWLQFHIFSGLVGPYLVFLHTAWRFNGLAGIVFLLTVIIVLSGFVGRYIYTAVPRTADGIEIQARELGAQILIIEAELTRQVAKQSKVPREVSQRLVFLPDNQSSRPSTVLGRFFQEISYRQAWRREQRQLDPATRTQVVHLESLAEQRRLLRRQMDSLAMTRRLLATWHTVHIPIGIVLFITAFAHIAGAVYYATLLHKQVTQHA